MRKILPLLSLLFLLHVLPVQAQITLGRTVVANAASTGTTLNTLTKLTGTPSTAVKTATTDTGGSIGITVAGAGTTGNATIQMYGGSIPCVFDGATTAGDYVQISSSTAGNCHDAGSGYPSSKQVIGRVLSTHGSGGTYSIDLFPAEIVSAVGGSVSCGSLPALTGDVTTSAGSCTTTVALVGGTAAATVKTRDFGTTFGDTTGLALTSGSVVYFTVPYACTIAAWNISVDAGTVTFDIWKIASGTAIPTVTNTITASALPALSTGTSIHSTTLTSWTTSVAANDIFGVQLKTVATAKYAEIDLQCNQ